MPGDETVAEEIGKLINQIRKDPKSFVPHLMTRLETYEGVNYTDSTGTKYKSQEGKDAVNEAIEELKQAKAVPVLNHSREIKQCAHAHCKYLATSGEVAHNDEKGNNLGKRLDLYGQWSGKINELIAVQSSTALDIVIQWIIDDGSKQRGDRNAILSTDFSYFEIGYSSEHKTYK